MNAEKRPERQGRQFHIERTIWLWILPCACRPLDAFYPWTKRVAKQHWKSRGVTEYSELFGDPLSASAYPGAASVRTSTAVAGSNAFPEEVVASMAFRLRF
jgi:hypothetical protein